LASGKLKIIKQRELVEMKLEYVLELVKQVSYADRLEFDDIEVDGNEIRIAGAGTYVVLDNEEIWEEMNSHLENSAGYLEPDFVAEMTGVDIDEIIEMEGDNKAVYELICEYCGLSKFIDKLIEDDGAGMYLNSCNGEEYYLGDGLSAFNR